MDLEVRWSPEATEDLEAIAGYIARDSEYYARAVVHAITYQEFIVRLAQHREQHKDYVTYITGRYL